MPGESIRDRAIVVTTAAPAVLGPYSQAVVAAGFVFTSGQIPIDPGSGAVVDGGIREQTARTIENLSAVLQAAGTSLARAVKTTCYLADLQDFSAFNEVYGTYFKVAPPSRSTVQVARLPLGVLVEIECIAAIG